VRSPLDVEDARRYGAVQRGQQREAVVEGAKAVLGAHAWPQVDTSTQG